MEDPIRNNLTSGTSTHTQGVTPHSQTSTSNNTGKTFGIHTEKGDYLVSDKALEDMKSKLSTLKIDENEQTLTVQSKEENHLLKLLLELQTQQNQALANSCLSSAFHNLNLVILKA